VLAGINPGSYSGGIDTDLSKPLPPEKPNPRLEEVGSKIKTLEDKYRDSRQPPDQKDVQEYFALQNERRALEKMQQDRALDHFQDDWATRVDNNGKVSGVKTDYHYFGTGDIGGAPDEESVKRLEAIITKGSASLPPEGYVEMGPKHPDWPEVKVGDGPVHVISARADQMFLDITPSETARLPRYTGEMELTNHSAGSLTSQAYQKRWLRKEELLADAAEKSSLAAEWLGARHYPLARLNDAWTLVMGGHFHDIAAGTATPKSYEFAWNDDVIAMNEFAAVVNNAVEAVSAGLATDTKGIAIIVFNPLNVEREDIVEASVTFPGGMPAAVRVIDPNGNDVPAQISNNKVIFAAKVPSVAYAVYEVQSALSPATGELRVSENSLENHYYLVKLNADGDVASIFDKSLSRELLSAPARLAISHDDPAQWPAWNMDWDQEQANPREYVAGAPSIWIVENGPARVALEVSRKTAGSTFVQTIRLSAGNAGKRVEFKNAIDWNTRESNLKATFPLTASNSLATYNWDIGVIERPTAEPKKFEVPSHQWIDLTDLSGEFGATILTDCKNGSDKPTDNTIRLTLLRTPGSRGGYPDQATQDLGHHEFIYGISGHSRGWRDAQTDWLAHSLNDPLIAFETPKHKGALGREFSFLQVNNPRVRVLALKKAEETDEMVVRLVELDGVPQRDVRVSFAAAVTSARELNGQEQPVGAATVSDGALVTSLGAFQPRTFAVRLAAPPSMLPRVNSVPVLLSFDTAAASTDGAHLSGGIDGKGNALPAEMLPRVLSFDDMEFHLAAAKTGAPNALKANGQTIKLPPGSFNRLYLLAASVDGDQKGAFEVAGKSVDLNVQDWSGFIGQWDNRRWVAKDRQIPARGDEPARAEHDDYAEMAGIQPGFIKRANIAWFCSHHHNAAGENVPYAYSYLFAYAIDLPPGAKTVSFPRNDKIRIFALSVAAENPSVIPSQPLYDTLDRSEP
jgi:alpha-mannosidase